MIVPAGMATSRNLDDYPGAPGAIEDEAGGSGSFRDVEGGDVDVPVFVGPEELSYGL